jgi:hypothetical protein
VLAKASLALFSHWMPAAAGIGDVSVSVSGSDLAAGFAAGLLCAFGAALIFVRPLFSARRIQRRGATKAPSRPATTPVSLLWRSIRFRPMRVLSVGLIVAAGTAVLGVAAGSLSSADASGTGGFALEVESQLPIAIDWSTAKGRSRLHFDPADEAAFAGVSISPMLRNPGADVSCLNPAKPVLPRISAVDSNFVRSAPFPAVASDGSNAWPLLDSPAQTAPDIPAIGDGDTLDWILGSGVGKEVDLQLPNGRPSRLKFVGATHGTFLAGDLLVSRAAFHRLYPEVEAPTLFLVKAPKAKLAALRAAIGRNLADYGVTVRDTESILASLRAVINAYLSIFLVFGSLGLVLGVCGSSLAAARNAMDRRPEYALMLAVGIARTTVRNWIVAETYLAVVAGAACGFAISAAVGIAERSGVSWLALIAATLAIVGAATVACFAVSSLFLRRGVLEALRSE